MHDIFATESSINFSFDYFEVGLWPTGLVAGIRSPKERFPPRRDDAAAPLQLHAK